MSTKNHGNRVVDELRPEYDLTSLTGRIQGKHVERATAGTTLVLLEPDIAQAFPNGRAVNRALRIYLSSKRNKVPDKLSQSESRAPKKASSKSRSRAAR